MRHGNRAIMRSVNASFLSVFVFCLLFLVYPDSVCHANSPYIYKVYEFAPAPGQFVNVLPAYKEDDTEEDMRQKAEDAIAGDAKGLVCLGGWGGFIVFGFDHMVLNMPDQRDLLIWGNAFENNAEPGIVYVSYDANDNGKPDDPWYEIAGSEYESATLDYQLTYYLPEEGHEAKPEEGNPYITDAEYILWRDQEGKTGYIAQNVYHKQSYFPRWVETEELTFTGSLLPNNATSYVENEVTKFLLPAFGYGYADNLPNTSEDAAIDLDWAVDEQGNPAHLEGVHFVKVMTGVNQQCGWLGETSTEISGAEDLHPDAVAPESIEGVCSPTLPAKRLVNGQLYIFRDHKQYTVTGTIINSINH